LNFVEKGSIQNDDINSLIDANNYILRTNYLFDITGNCVPYNNKIKQVLNDKHFSYSMKKALISIIEQKQKETGINCPKFII
jgi:hypothetical protein